MDELDVRYAISARKHLARGLRILATGIEAGSVPLSSRAWELVCEFFRECLPPAPPADSPTTAPPAGSA